MRAWLLLVAIGACAGPQPDDCTKIQLRVRPVLAHRDPKLMPAALDQAAAAYCRTTDPILRRCLLDSLSDADTTACLTSK